MNNYRYLLSCITLILVLLLFNFTFDIHTVFADEYEYEERNEFGEDDELNGDGEDNEILEEIGEFTGWGTMVLGGFAGILLPFRRSAKYVKRICPSYLKVISKLSRLLTKWHIPLGLGVLIFGAVHGITTYLAESELGIHEIIGIISFLVIIVSSIFGGLIVVTRKSKFPGVHKLSIICAAVLAFMHIIL